MEEITTMEVIIFSLEDRKYAVDVQYVQSIERLLPITRVPGTDPYIKGVANLRGSVFPIMDLRERLGMAGAELTEENRVVVTTIGEIEMGFIVDTMHDVMDVPIDKMEAPSHGLNEEERDVLQGTVNMEGGIIMLLNMESIIRLSDS